MPKVVVVGGGATGMATTLALRAANHQVEYYDPNPRGGMCQGAIMLWSNGMKALARVLDPAELAEGSVIVHRVDLRTWEGDPLYAVPVSRLSGTEFPSRLVHRETLLDKLRAKAGSSTGLAFWNFRRKPHGVEVIFTNGHVEPADMLIGAEGAHSTVRRRLFGLESMRSTGQAIVFGYSPKRSELAPPGVCYCLMDADHRFFAGGILLKDKPHRTYWGVSVPRSACTIVDGKLTLEKDELRRLFRGSAPDVDRLIESTPASEIIVLPSQDRRPGMAWHKGPVGLLGDAAHPLTYDLGQGQCLAFEDAVVLKRLYRNGLKAPVALAKLEAERRHRVNLLTEISFRAAQFSTPGNELAAGLRDFFTANLYAPLNERSMRYMFDVDLDDCVHDSP